MMKITHLLSFGHLFLAAAQAVELDVKNASEFDRCVSASAKLERLATDMKFVEGPQWFPADGGFLVFSDIPSNELKKWSDKAGLSAFRNPSGNTNGNTIGNDGLLLSAEHGGRRISRTDASGAVVTVVDRFEGKRLNSPNDVVVSSDGAIWFTDPDYGLPSDPETRQKVGKELPGEFVFRFDPRTKALRAVATDFAKPNGLCFSPDGSRLYVADSGAPRHIRAFDAASDGSLRGGEVFAKIDKGGPDGIRCDADGRVWSSAGDGVHVFSPRGELLGKILVPEAPANLAFGGADMRTLYITARKSLYAVPVLVRGVR
jgi:gluconolactonase